MKVYYEPQDWSQALIEGIVFKVNTKSQSDSYKLIILPLTIETIRIYLAIMLALYIAGQSRSAGSVVQADHNCHLLPIFA
jgi:hypothetical protein